MIAIWSAARFHPGRHRSRSPAGFNQENIANSTSADVYFGRGQKILLEREKESDDRPSRTDALTNTASPSDVNQQARQILSSTTNPDLALFNLTRDTTACMRERWCTPWQAFWPPPSWLVGASGAKSLTAPSASPRWCTGEFARTGGLARIVILGRRYLEQNHRSPLSRRPTDD